jgi:hypothetical protein
MVVELCQRAYITVSIHWHNFAMQKTRIVTVTLVPLSRHPCYIAAAPLEKNKLIMRLFIVTVS